MKAKLLTQSFVLCGKARDFGYDWNPEESNPRECEYNFNDKLLDRENAALLADNIVEKLLLDYSVMKIDPCPKAVSVWGTGWFGAEVFYQNQNGTMKISARVITTNNR